MDRLTLAVAEYDPEGNFVELERFIPNTAIATELTRADLFIYASSCENLPVTLLEAMAAGLPIASSNRGPMPEVLGDAATFFDPENPGAIAAAVFSVINDQALRERIRADAQHRARAFTWNRCADLTWQVLLDSAIDI
jgi:glycosyltransferase involved in cell wall biosynthesis